MDQKNTNNKEKTIVTVSAIFVLAALTFTGMYINNSTALKNPITKEQNEAGDLSNGVMQTPNLEDLQSVDSTTVENPGITNNSIVAEDIKTPASQSSNTLVNEAVTGNGVTEELAEQAMTGEVENMIFSFDGMNMIWPVSEKNDILIPYSMDQAVYFKTLDQYKYNPAIIISAEVGTPVYAVSAGRIVERYWDYETGWTYEMDLGGGFKAYYGQLENMQKAEDTYVAAGDVLGFVASPTKYYAEDGSNLYFAMTKDGQPVYPKDYVGE